MATTPTTIFFGLRVDDTSKSASSIDNTCTTP
jgi:hypothetical protein